MRKIICTLLSVFMILSVFGVTSYADDTTTLVMRIDSSKMIVNGNETDIDNMGTSPLIADGRTLVPIRGMIEALGGNISWDSGTQTATLNHNKDEIRLTVNSYTAYYNDEEKTLDTAPVIIKGRTMLPVRFIAENFGFDVDWNESEKTITIIKNGVIEGTKQTDTEKISENTDSKTDNNNIKQENRKVLIAYFSWSGNTKDMADAIQKSTDGTVYEIISLNGYPEEYKKCTEVALQERDENARPEIKDLPDSLDEYDSIFIGYPIWWHTAPMIIGTFLENYDLTGKNIYPFTQSASMDEEQFKNSMDFVRECAKGASVHDGLFARPSDKDTITSYLQENGFID